MNHQSDTDVQQLQELVIEMSKTITRLTDDFYLKAVVGSVFDTMSVEDTIDDLRALNEGERPEWLFTVRK